MTTLGAFSVVKKRGDTCLTVRSRSLRDMENLVNQLSLVRGRYHQVFSVKSDKMVICKTQTGFSVTTNCIVSRDYDFHKCRGMDYPYRIFISPIAFSSIISDHISRFVQYDNFKSEIAYFDPVRAEIYHKIWGTLTEIERPLPVPKSKSTFKKKFIITKKTQSQTNFDIINSFH